MKKNNHLDKICRLLKNNEVVAIPTDTVYGLAGNAYSVEAMKKIFQVKERPLFNPLIVHTCSIKKAKEFVEDFPEALHDLAKKFWPGALTILLKKKGIIPDLVTAGSKFVGVRIPKKKITLRLLSKLSFPLAAPSANPFNYISPTRAFHVRKNFKNKIAAILRGGNCEIGVESTIISLENNTIFVHRLGGITVEMLNQATPLAVEISDKKTKEVLPGSLQKHYSPITKLIICENLEEEIKKRINSNFAVLSFCKKYPLEKLRVLSISQDMAEASHNLYSFLRELDEMKADFILTEKMPAGGLGDTINDRLARAAY